MKHVNELTPWTKAINKANDYYNLCSNATTEPEKDKYFYMWTDIRFEIQSGFYGNNS